jgi:hypothetical protein
MIAELMLVLIDYNTSVIQRPSIPNHGWYNYDERRGWGLGLDADLFSIKESENAWIA